MNHLQDDIDHHPVATGSQLIEQVPVIDIQGLDGILGQDPAVDPGSDSPVIREIADACSDWGFFQVVNHGIPPALVNAAWEQSRWLFSRPRAEKHDILRDRANPWGYYDNELTKNQRDRKEVFDFTVTGVDPIYGGENRWPDGDDAFRRVMLDYLAACETLSLRLLRAFCRGLGLPADRLDADFDGCHTGFVRLNYYPVDDPLAGSDIPHLDTADLGVHHHTDAGALTVLLQDDIGGLQVHRDGLWYDIPVVEGAMVINTGDMMQVWSNDRYKAAMHRVLAMKEKDRYSIPFFYNPAAGTVAAPLDGVGDDAPRYRPIPWSEFRGQRTDGDYADYGEEVQISQYRTVA